MYLPETDSIKIVEAIRGFNVHDKEVALIMLGEKNKPDVDQMIASLNEMGIEFLGGVFPGIIYGDKSYEQGAVVSVLPAVKTPYLIKGFNQQKIQLPELGQEVEGCTAIVLIDGLTSNIAFFLCELFNRLGQTVHYFGGGAGSLSLKQAPCLFTRGGFVQDAAVITFVQLKSNLGVRHGWEKVMTPFVATKTNKNVISELNWKNALQAYREVVEADSGKKLSEKDFYSLSMSYPFGMFKENAEDIVRDPIATNEKGELICVGEVPQNSVLSILRGNKASLIQAAGQAASDCQNLVGEKVSHCLVADCISRALFLGEDFEKELALVKQKIATINDKCMPEGMLTLGEIASYGERFLEFFNKTIVVALLQKF
ncbi:MAG: FIST C-terminal domain-containing protein [bacterium]